MSIKECNYPVSDNVAKIIDKKGLKRKAVAEKAGYSEQMLCDMLNGRRIIKITDVITLGKALDVNTNTLFRCPEEPTEDNTLKQ